jgi:hypothetical protein
MIVKYLAEFKTLSCVEGRKEGKKKGGRKEGKKRKQERKESKKENTKEIRNRKELSQLLF